MNENIVDPVYKQQIEHVQNSVYVLTDRLTVTIVDKFDESNSVCLQDHEFDEFILKAETTYQILSYITREQAYCITAYKYLDCLL